MTSDLSTGSFAGRRGATGAFFVGVERDDVEPDDDGAAFSPEVHAWTIGSLATFVTDPNLPMGGWDFGTISGAGNPLSVLDNEPPDRPTLSASSSFRNHSPTSLFILASGVPLGGPR